MRMHKQPVCATMMPAGAADALNLEEKVTQTRVLLRGARGADAPGS